MVLVFEVDSISLQYAPALGTYHKNRNLRNVLPTNISEHSVPFWRTHAL